MAKPDFTNQAAQSIASSFVQARLAGAALAQFPGAMPTTAAQAYACQDIAITLWPKPIAGWKVGLVAPEARQQFGEERVVGPVFQGLLRHVSTDVESCPVFAGGFAAVEAEFVFRLKNDAPPGQLIWSAPQAAELVDGLFVGVEIASSPLATINDLGPLVIAADFGNNFGLLIGPEIQEWRGRALASLRCETSIDGQAVGQGAASSIPGGPLTALAFALSRCAQRGHALKAGQYVCTGATTGVHVIRPGQIASIHFHGVGTLQCEAVAAGVYPAVTGR